MFEFPPQNRNGRFERETAEQGLDYAWLLQKEGLSSVAMPGT